MKRIIIVGAGSVANEIYAELRVINQQEIEKGNEAKYDVIGFLDDNPDALLKYPHIDKPLLGKITNWTPIDENVSYVLGIAAPKVKEKIVNDFKLKGCRFETIIASHAVIMPNVEIGEGSFVFSYYTSCGARIGNYVHVMGSSIGEAVIGDFSTTLGFANIANGKLGKRVYVCSHATILDAVVEDDAFVAVGSVVMRRVKAGTKVFGNPAKKVDW